MSRKRPIRYAWLTVKDDILDEIYDKHYQPGDRIATVASLAKRCGVSTSTVRQAVAELASEGVLDVRQGRGTTVASPKIDYDPTEGFQEQATRLGGEAVTEIVETRWRSSHSDSMRALGLRQSRKVWELVRQHRLDGMPVMIEVSVFMRQVAPLFMADTSLLTSLHQALDDQVGENKWESRVTSVGITTERLFSDLLEIPRRTMFYHIERLVSLGSDPLLVSFLVLRSDRFQLRFGKERPQLEARREELVAVGGSNSL